MKIGDIVLLIIPLLIIINSIICLLLAKYKQAIYWIVDTILSLSAFIAALYFHKTVLFVFWGIAIIVFILIGASEDYFSKHKRKDE